MDDTLRNVPPIAAFVPGQMVGPYRILREIGRGGMGAVFLCEDTAIGDRQVALKVILDTHGAGIEMIDRFKREVKNLGKLRHPNIVQVLYAGEHEGHPYFVMEYVPGREFTRWLGEVGSLAEPQRIRAIVDLVMKVCEGVAHAHRNGMVHRDLKPQNILVREDGEPLILDFGISKHQDDTTLTGGTTSPGTPSYMAPEQFEPQLIVKEHLIDVWALGTILYAALTRERPFRGQSLASVTYQVVHGSPIAPTKLNPDIPPALEAIVLECLEKDPHKRPQSVEDLRQRLESALDVARRNERSRKLRSRMLAITSVLALIVVIARPWHWFDGKADVSGLRPVLRRVGGRVISGAEPEVPVPGFQTTLGVVLDGLPRGVTCELVLVGGDGSDVARMALNPAGDLFEALLAIPLEKQREGMRASLACLANGTRVPFAGTAAQLVFDWTPPRISARLVSGAVTREWLRDEVVEVEPGTTLSVTASDPTTPVVIEDVAGDGSTMRLGVDGPVTIDIAGAERWTRTLRARDGAGNATERRFEARIAQPASRTGSRPTESRPPKPAGLRPAIAWSTAPGKIAWVAADQQIAIPDAVREVALEIERDQEAADAVVTVRVGTGDEETYASSRSVQELTLPVPTNVLEVPVDIQLRRASDTLARRTITISRTLPPAWATPWLVSGQTKFLPNEKSVLKGDANVVTFRNEMPTLQLAWSLRFVSKDGAALCSWLPLRADSIFATSRPADAALLTTTIPGTLLPAGVDMTAELLVVDALNRKLVQPVPERVFVVDRSAMRPRVKLTTNVGSVVIEVEPTWAPIVVEAFLDHVKAGDYDGTILHEVKRDQSIRGGILTTRGEPKKVAAGTPAAETQGTKRQKNARFTVAMVGSAELMIYLQEKVTLSAITSTVFGRVAGESEAVVTQIAAGEVRSVGKLQHLPKTDILIRKAEILAPGSN